MRFKWSIKQHFPEKVSAVLSDFGLLPWIAMIFETENNWVVRCFKSGLSNCLYHISSTYFRYECVSKKNLIINFFNYQLNTFLYKSKIINNCDDILYPCTMTGSSNFPFQKSNSTHRQPDRRH